MKRMFSLTVIILSFISASSFGSDSFTISGSVNFRGKGDLYICLFNLEQYTEFQRPGYELSQSPCKSIKMNDELRKVKTVSFEFENIPAGTYTIVSYRDVNFNGKVDFATLIKEPWATYKEKDPIVSPTWNLIKFDLKENLSDIKIQM